MEEDIFRIVLGENGGKNYINIFRNTTKLDNWIEDNTVDGTLRNRMKLRNKVLRRGGGYAKGNYTYA